MTSARLIDQLTQQEMDAGKAYGADSKFFHGCWQDRQDDLVYHPDYAAFARTYAQVSGALDSAVAKSILQEDLTVYSGYGRGYSILGSLTGDAVKFVGLVYQYPGFISTSTNQRIAEDKFLRVGASAGTRPTFLEFKLLKGQIALDMNAVGITGELEYLLPRRTPFSIVDAKETRVQDVDDAVLHLILAAV
ncbi:ADP-ribosyltransferase [Bradyrhizobium sp. HKCCYLS3013]|uniref:ADP-ribosyltransferase n=1 Tax=Bradyrhizobium sp. HKCCYLS3013 TaxID=3420735 RepID=UPI003EC02C54